MTDKEKQIYALIVGIKSYIKGHNVLLHDSEESKFYLTKCKQALALLKAAQEPCGNPDCENGIVTVWDTPKSARTYSCPACQSQEPNKPYSEYTPEDIANTKEAVEKLRKLVEPESQESAKVIPDKQHEPGCQKGDACKCDQEPAAQPQASEFVKKIERIAHALPNKPSPDETKAFFVALTDTLFDTIDSLEAATQRADAAEARCVTCPAFVDKDKLEDKLKEQAGEIEKLKSNIKFIQSYNE